MTKFIDEYIKKLKNNDKVSIIKIKKGLNAIKIISKIFFTLKNKDVDKKWLNKWSSYEKSNAILIIYKYKKQKNSDIHFKFIIGKNDNRSVLGERMTEKKGKDVLKLLNIL